MALAFRTINPATGELVHEYPHPTAEGLESLVASAHAAFLAWSNTEVSDRAALFTRVADLFEERKDQFARAVTLEMGKPLIQSVVEADLAISMFRYYAERGAELLADEVLDVPGLSKAIVRKEPLGVVVGIEPWNGPLYQAMRAVAPNLMLGNTILLKPSEQCALSTLLFDALFQDAGFPAGVYQTALISHEQAAQLIADDRVRAVTFTGSERAGRVIGALAAENVKPVTLELGGSDPYVVLESADVAAAAATVCWWRLYIGGQVCISPKRIILEDGIADSFIDQFVPAFGNVVLGDGMDEATTLGPMISADAAARVQAQVDDAIDKGATVLLDGGQVDDTAFFRPVALTGITPQMRIFQEEVFGPVAMIYRVADADAAVALANDTPYGLGGTVWGEQDAALAVARRIDTGGVGINGPLGSPIEIPFGGTKKSGTGRELGKSGMDGFANIKTYGLVG
ncbi:NAD-dependent succinate-semialdehyde dehydrogenase [Microbacterium aoyamense]|uniref:NAD-dependent succinate-semialdehyde dehydrogenase n=1 Tax=Microbacterium aoyamense TaxID=344166 RepID=A0ABP5B6F0_9MICO|nr:aldehyde dehydrogenase family protein [Microbacterium aoyamense]